ncbi:hypothetical protein AC579_9567 [Pseudocercospora musae]|uniref:HMG box domain-containing protein n=1 Tax=Pseudocercospora musae TaxID=113226 RepID=A0A139IIF5_9PEZI|nr:hypothetical protein AC579_9567 [Pseudocercospora musae]
MSAIQHSCLPIPQDRQWLPPIQTQAAHDSGGRIIFTRQLWQRTMPDGNQSDNAVLNKSQAQDTRRSHHITAHSSRRTSSSVSSRSQRQSPSPSRTQGESKTPLTPEESPPFRITRKRTAAIVESEDKDLDHAEASSPAHIRSGSGDIHVCICQPDPKIPRPRNAFILYRQHHQASVVNQNPGLANPEISKIIGEQWQNQPPEVKSRWKQLAEEEKLRHQQQYPTYRYQPKRSARRNSLSSEAGGSAVEKPRCQKCGGRSILAPSTPYSNINSTGNSPASAHTPASINTPVSRTLPVLRDLSLQSPAARRMGRQFPNSNMSPGPHGHPDERDDLGPLSPDLKRRRYNGEHPTTMSRSLPSRYAVAPPPGQPGPPVGPGTPFPFAQGPPHPYPPGANAAHVRRESLPGLRGVVSPPGPMAPPPRPGPGYQQHRLSQGHIPHDRSLTLPPLQTGSSSGIAGTVATAGTGKTAKEQIMSLDFWYKVKVLSQVAPPRPVRKSSPRGPFVAIEGDSPDAVKALGSWLTETLSKGDDLNVRQIDGPSVSSQGSKEQIMAQYHRLAADWLLKTADIVESLSVRNSSPTDSVMVDVPTKAKSREVDEDYEDPDDSPKESRTAMTGRDDDSSGNTERSNSDTTETMDVDARKSSVSSTGKGLVASGSAKPVSIVVNYSLYASNFFACHIPIEAHARYSPKDHWEWTATHWRGIISPDLTIYVRDGVAADTGKQSVEIMDDGNLFVVKRTKADSKDALEVEPSTLRRLGFEVSEWVRAFGQSGKMED